MHHSVSKSHPPLDQLERRASDVNSLEIAGRRAHQMAKLAQHCLCTLHEMQHPLYNDPTRTKTPNSSKLTLIIPIFPLRLVAGLALIQPAHLFQGHRAARQINPFSTFIHSKLALRSIPGGVMRPSWIATGLSCQWSKRDEPCGTSTAVDALALLQPDWPRRGWPSEPWYYRRTTREPSSRPARCGASWGALTTWATPSNSTRLPPATLKQSPSSIALEWQDSHAPELATHRASAQTGER
jgi:hypothetical protein